MDGKRVWIVGNTYPYKNAIRNAGGHWDSDAGKWWIGATKLEEVQQLLTKVKPMISYAKIGDAWGVRGVGAPPAIGEAVVVSKRDGSQQEETIEQIVSSDGQEWTASLKQKAKSAKKPGAQTPFKSNKCGNCGGTAGRRGQYGRYEGGTCSCCRPNCNCYDCRS